MIGESTRAAVGDQFEVRLLDLLVVKGKTRPIKVYELLGVTGQVEDRRLRVRALYEEALNLHWDRRFAEAVELLEQGQEIMSDEASRLLEQRIRRYIENPPPDDWKGEFVNLSK
jgi:adenylate cyclase